MKYKWRDIGYTSQGLQLLCFLIDDLGPGDLGTICEELAKVKYKWLDIGLNLHVPYHKLKEFEHTKNPYVEVINYWLNGNVKDVSVTWRSIVTVLESSRVDEIRLAKTIMAKYCSQPAREHEFEPMGSVSRKSEPIKG